MSGEQAPKKFDSMIDLIVVAALTILAMAAVMVPPINQTILRPVLSFPLLLFLPGYVMMSALFPGKDDLDEIERIALSLGLSIFVTVFIGFGLDYTPWGIRIEPILVAIAGFILVMTVVTAVIRLRVQERGENASEDDARAHN